MAYQGRHGCLTIAFDRGVCGKCARERTTQVVTDVAALPYHLACSGSSRSEIVVPLFDAAGDVKAVLDIDSDQPAACDATDRGQREALARRVEAVYRVSRPASSA